MTTNGRVVEGGTCFHSAPTLQLYSTWHRVTSGLQPIHFKQNSGRRNSVSTTCSLLLGKQAGVRLRDGLVPSLPLRDVTPQKLSLEQRFTKVINFISLFIYFSIFSDVVSNRDWINAIKFEGYKSKRSRPNLTL